MATSLPAAVASQLAAATSAVRLACVLSSRVQASLLDTDKLVKDDLSPVTVADFGVQALISLSLRSTLGLEAADFRMVAEEDAADLREPGNRSLCDRVVKEVNSTFTAAGDKAWSEEAVLEAVDTGSYAGGGSSPYWVLDPIDGTKGFVRKQQYCVGLALVGEDGVPAIGVLGCPNLWTDAEKGPDGPTGCIFSAVRGHGAFMTLIGDDASAEAEPVKLSVSTLEDSTAARFCESYETGHSSRGISTKIAAALGVTREPVRIDSMCKYGIVSRGEASLYLRFPRAGYVEKVWDHAAGVVVLTEAGGTVTDLWGKPLDFTAGRKLSNNLGVIASNGKFHDKALAAAQEAYKAERPDGETGVTVSDGLVVDAGATGAGAGSSAL